MAELCICLDKATVTWGAVLTSLRIITSVRTVCTQSPDFFSRKFFNTFHEEIGFFVWLLFSSLEKLVGQWYVQHAAIRHCYLPLCILLFFLLRICSFLFKYFFFFLIWYLNWLINRKVMIPACPSLMCLFDRAIPKGLILLKLCV